MLIFLVLIHTVFAGGFEVNFMDDVGQTLLNWASAFGTLEMVSEIILNFLRHSSV